MPDTIAAIATASAAAAVGIVRLSGAETRRVLAALFTPVEGRSAAELPPRRMTYGTVHDAEGRTLDHALAGVVSAGAEEADCPPEQAGRAKSMDRDRHSPKSLEVVFIESFLSLLFCHSPLMRTGIQCFCAPTAAYR